MAAAEAAEVEIEFVTEDVLDSMADTVTPQGFVSVCRQFPTSLKDIVASEPRLVAVLEEVRDPGNLGTIIRAADAAGADAVVLTGRSVDLYNPKVVRSTTGSLFHLPVAVDAELADVLQRLRRAGLRAVAADVKGEDLLAIRDRGDLAQPTVWVFGNEARGLEDESLGSSTPSWPCPSTGPRSRSISRPRPPSASTRAPSPCIPERTSTLPEGSLGESRGCYSLIKKTLMI